MTESRARLCYFRADGYCRACGTDTGSYARKQHAPDGLWVRCGGPDDPRADCGHVVWASDVDYAEFEKQERGSQR